MRTISTSMLVAALSVCLVACGDDDASSTTDSGPGGGGDTGAAGAMCDNTSDRAALEMNYPDAMGMDRDVPGVARDCAIEVCLSVAEDMQEQCMNDCLTDMTDLSAACASCVTLSVACIQDYCLSRCLSDPDSADCLACQCGDNPMGVSCRGMYDTCSGVPSMDCM